MLLGWRCGRVRERLLPPDRYEADAQSEPFRDAVERVDRWIARAALDVLNDAAADLHLLYEAY